MPRARPGESRLSGKRCGRLSAQVRVRRFLPVFCYIAFYYIEENAKGLRNGVKTTILCAEVFMRKILFFLVLTVSFTACKNTAAGGTGTGPKLPELVDFVSKSWYEAHKDTTAKINYTATINGTPVLENSFKWYNHGKYLYLENADHTNTAGFDPNFRGWYIALYPETPHKNNATTFLIKDADDESKFEKKLKITKVKILNGHYFDTDSGQPFELELTVQNHPPVIIKGNKK